MMKKAAVLLLAASAVGCAASFNRPAMEARLQAQYRVFGDVELQPFNAFQPSGAPPFRLAVAPPLDGSAWAQAEREEIQSWEEPLRQAGVVSEIVLIPRMVVQWNAGVSGGAVIRTMQNAAARMNADAVLITAAVSEVDGYTNPLCLLYLTVAGLWLAPGTHRDAFTVMEGVLLDARSGYLHTAAEGEGLARSVRPLLCVDDEPVLRESRLLALRAFGREFVKHARRLSPAAQGPRYETPRK